MGLRTLLGVMTLVVLTVVERRRPLRRAIHPPNQRLLVNVVVGAGALAASAAIQWALVGYAAAWAERRGIGLIRWLGLGPWLAGLTAVVLLDYTLWHWHRWNHTSGWLWRVHAPHHADLDLDASTALRFHPGELVLSVPYRALQVCAIGVTLGQLFVWETLVMVFVQFHHSNLRLPRAFERGLGWVIITPRIHGIHHSRRPGELHSNFGTLLSVWDRLHGLRVEGIPQPSIEIGLPHQDDALLGIGATLALPLSRPAPRRA